MKSVQMVALLGLAFVLLCINFTDGAPRARGRGSAGSKVSSSRRALASGRGSRGSGRRRIVEDEDDDDDDDEEDEEDEDEYDEEDEEDFEPRRRGRSSNSGRGGRSPPPRRGGGWSKKSSRSHPDALVPFSSKRSRRGRGGTFSKFSIPSVPPGWLDKLEVLKDQSKVALKQGRTAYGAAFRKAKVSCDSSPRPPVQSIRKAT
jgi:hypothetical protein